MTVSVQFIEGLDEEIGGISLRKRQNDETKIVVLTFDRLRALEQFRSLTKKIDALLLRDEEGEIRVIPSGIKFIFEKEDELSKAFCTFEVDSQSAFERVMRFLHRYAEANGFEFRER